MSAEERDCALTLDSAASPLALVSERLATAHGATPQEFARELRAQHMELLQRLPARVFESHSHLVPYTSSGVDWVFAVMQLHAHGVQAVMLIAVLRDEVSSIGPAVKSMSRELARRTGRFLQ